MGQFLTFLESINDKYLFKSVFMAGGPGSGKSFVSDKMFTGLPVQFVNSDIFFEKMLKKEDLPFKINPDNKQVYVKQMDVRTRSKALTGKQATSWINGMLPLIVDGTGRDYAKIKEQRNFLDSIGYDTAMIFVNTSLPVALQRNKERDRSVPEEFVKQGWEQVQGNTGKLQELFGGNFDIIDNSEQLSPEEEKEFELKMVRMAMKKIQAPMRNKIGLNIIKLLNDTGGLYMSDIGVGTKGMKI